MSRTRYTRSMARIQGVKYHTYTHTHTHTHTHTLMPMRISTSHVNKTLGATHSAVSSMRIKSEVTVLRRPFRTRCRFSAVFAAGLSFTNTRCLGTKYAASFPSSGPTVPCKTPPPRTARHAKTGKPKKDKHTKQPRGECAEMASYTVKPRSNTAPVHCDALVALSCTSTTTVPDCQP